ADGLATIALSAGALTRHRGGDLGWLRGDRPRSYRILGVRGLGAHPHGVYTVVAECVLGIRVQVIEGVRVLTGFGGHRRASTAVGGGDDVAVDRFAVGLLRGHLRPGHLDAAALRVVHP